MSLRERCVIALVAMGACTRTAAPAREDAPPVAASHATLAGGRAAEPPVGTPVEHDGPYTPPMFPAAGEVRVESIAQQGARPTIDSSTVSFHPETCFVPREHPAVAAWLSLYVDVSAAGDTSNARLAGGQGRVPRAVLACLTAQLTGQKVAAHGRAGVVEVRLWLLGTTDGGVLEAPPTTPIVVE